MKMSTVAVAAFMLVAGCEASAPVEPIAAPRYSAVPSGTLVQITGIAFIPEVGQQFVIQNTFEPGPVLGCQSISFAGRITGIFTGPAVSGMTHWVWTTQELPPGTRLRLIQFHYWCSGLTGALWTAEVM